MNKKLISTYKPTAQNICPQINFFRRNFPPKNKSKQTQKLTNLFFFPSLLKASMQASCVYGVNGTLLRFAVCFMMSLGTVVCLFVLILQIVCMYSL